MVLNFSESGIRVYTTNHCNVCVPILDMCVLKLGHIDINRLYFAIFGPILIIFSLMCSGCRALHYMCEWNKKSEKKSRKNEEENFHLLHFHSIWKQNYITTFFNLSQIQICNFSRNGPIIIEIWMSEVILVDLFFPIFTAFLN